LVLLLLLTGSAALILGPADSKEFRDVAELMVKTEDKALTALMPRPQADLPKTKAELAPAPVHRPAPLAPPIPLPGPIARPVIRTAAPRRPATRTMRMLVTAYCPCRICCGKFSDSVTASGKNIYANGSIFVAADTRLLKFGTMVSIPGYRGGRAVPVLDRGGKIKGHRIDVFYLSHRQAQKWGRRYLDVEVRIGNR